MQAMEDQARMLRGGLDALRAREEALRTAQTLDADLAHKRTRAENLQAANNPKAVRTPTTLRLPDARCPYSVHDYDR